ncbi:TnsA endonuclease N-terminal domain-containing protein [Paraburkholderia humisilvae]|uniref:Transposon Tn7 transposition protein TnsA n=1 Tax=Paraburkholderia humisilvae TaxID=627669 RepID=A0A6J5DPF9_9BURK|nr:TnsA endonuclease N-terminal domain-containing protein [Paraburkholderia humisilvae]CAB3755407.1 Transposon Tn7 transposition protein TnsA [Paraburkholderia humisilvae]
MAKRKYVIDSTKMARFIKEGRGQGSGANYKPWLTIQDVPSDGRVHRPYGWKTQRVHQLLSDIEYRHFLLLDWAPGVIDIREQFPLDRDKTIAIAEEAGIKHPKDPRSDELEVMTTDFLVVLGSGTNRKLEAWAIKPAKELDDARVMEKLEIERRYWATQEGVKWYISTERELPMDQIESLDWMRSAWDINDIQEPRKGYFAELMHRLVSYVQANTRNESRLNTVCSSLDEKCDCVPGTHLFVARHLLARRVLTTDIDRKNLWETPLMDICVDTAVFRVLASQTSGAVPEDRRAA